MAKQNIAIVTGGYSSEIEISLESVKTIYDNLSSEKYNKYIVIIEQNSWNVKIENDFYTLDKNDFSFTKNGEKIAFDCAYITIHGTPGEDGKLQGYFDMINIPYTTCKQIASSLTFNKWACNQVLLNNDFNCSKSLIFNDKNENFNSSKIISELGLPCFVKPNDGGSSFGITKVKTENELIPAINKAFSEGNEVMIEAFLDGIEVTCGCYKYKGEIYTLPLCEIVSQTDFFDYEAKYKGLSDEIVPARISNELTLEVQKLATQIYKFLDLKGITRTDFIIQNNIPYIIEVNTTPGMSKESIIPKMVKAQDNLDISQLLDWMIEEAIGGKN